MSAILDINWFYFGLEEFKLTVTRSTIIKILNTICLFVFIQGNDDLYIYTFLLSLGALVSQLVLWFRLKKYIFFVKPTISEIYLHIKPNIVLFLPVVAISIYNTMDKIMLGSLSSMEQVGFYENSFKLTSIPVMAISSLGTVMLPRITNLLSKGDNEVVDKYIKKSLILSVILSTPMTFGLAGICNVFVPFFYGEGFSACVQIIPVLIFSSIFISWANVIRTQYLIPNNEDKIYIVSVFLGAIINVILNIIFIPRYQAVGAAYGTLCAEMIVCCYQTYRVRSKIDIVDCLKISFPFILISTLMFLIVFNVPFTINLLTTIIIKVLIGVMIYFIFSLLYIRFIIEKSL